MTCSGEPLRRHTTVASLASFSVADDQAAAAGHRHRGCCRIERGLVRITTLTLLEVGYSARSGADARALSTGPVIAAMPVEYLVPKAEDLAREIQLLLAERGQHRALSVADILIAATAALAGLTVLHLDTDFDLIADLTGQPVERLRT